MTVRITDPRCLALISEVEFDPDSARSFDDEIAAQDVAIERTLRWMASWCEEQMLPHTGHFTFLRALEAWGVHAASGYEGGRGALCIFTMYGTGGSHRWLIMSDGSVRFSRMHAGEEACRLARALGFDING